MTDAELLQGPQIGAVVDAVRRNPVAGPMTGKKAKPYILPAPLQNIGRGIAVGRTARHLLLQFKIVTQRVQAAATDNRKH